MAKRQPGHGDGGRLKPRFDRKKYEEIPETVMDDILCDCLEFVLIKATSGDRSEGSFDVDIAKLAASYRRSGRNDLADALPVTLRQMMTLLRDSLQVGYYCHHTKTVCVCK